MMLLRKPSHIEKCSCGISKSEMCTQFNAGYNRDAPISDACLSERSLNRPRSHVTMLLRFASQLTQPEVNIIQRSR